MILTDEADDSAGGDTNANGASSGAAAQWEGVVFNPGSGGSLNFADIRYGGSCFVSNVELNSASPTLTSCTIRNCFTDGLDLNTNSNPIVSGCTFTNNGGYAIQRAPIGAVPGITNNTGVGQRRQLDPRHERHARVERHDRLGLEPQRRHPVRDHRSSFPRA